MGGEEIGVLAKRCNAASAIKLGEKLRDSVAAAPAQVGSSTFPVDEYVRFDQVVEEYEAKYTPERNYELLLDIYRRIVRSHNDSSRATAIAPARSRGS